MHDVSSKGGHRSKKQLYGLLGLAPRAAHLEFKNTEISAYC